MKSISHKVFIYIFISLFVVFIGRFLYGIHVRTQFELKRLEKNSVLASTRLANISVKPILNNDLNLLKSYVSIEALDENIYSIQILNQNNRLYTGSLRTKKGLSQINSDQLLVLHQDSIVKPVLYQGKMIGKIVVYSNKEVVQQYIGELKLIFFLELGAFF